MNIRNCRSCGKIFNYITGAPICPSCRETAEAKFQEVKEYIREHRGAGIAEVAEACEVEVSQIRQWLRDERLEVTEDSVLFLNCESCGAPIRSGRFCDKCKSGITKEFKAVLQSGTNHDSKANRTNTGKDGGAKMRFL